MIEQRLVAKPGTQISRLVELVVLHYGDKLRAVVDVWRDGWVRVWDLVPGTFSSAYGENTLNEVRARLIDCAEEVLG